MEEVRCKKCGKLLFKKGKKVIDLTGVPHEVRQDIEKGISTIEIVCQAWDKETGKRCKTKNTFKI